MEVDDIAEAVAERIGRQGYLLQRNRQFVFVIEEPVLRFRPYGTGVQRDQLTHLLDIRPASEVGHHPDIDIRWQRIRFGITTHDAGCRITDLDFALARYIDAIAAGHGVKPVPAGDA